MLRSQSGTSSMLGGLDSALDSETKGQILSDTFVSLDPVVVRRCLAFHMQNAHMSHGSLRQPCLPLLAPLSVFSCGDIGTLGSTSNFTPGCGSKFI